MIRQLIFSINWYKTARFYKAELNPFRIIWINPGEVYQKRTSYPEKQTFPCCVVEEHDFDLDKRELPEAEQLRERVMSGIEWHNTRQHQTMLERFILKGKSQQDLEEYYTGFENLYYSIRENGFMPPDGVTEGVPGIEKRWKPDSMAVNIGRDGDFFHYTGFHRMRIAKMLNIKQVPVRVIARHKKWQMLRERIFEESKSGKLSEYSEKFINHPDIAYLLQDSILINKNNNQ